MSDSENQHRDIKLITWPDFGRGQDPTLRSGDAGQLLWVTEYHGDHEMAWVILIKDGIEVTRHNPRFLESIVWAVLDSTAQNKSSESK